MYWPSLNEFKKTFDEDHKYKKNEFKKTFDEDHKYKKNVGVQKKTRKRYRDVLVRDKGVSKHENVS
jgi:hypothetical protein